MKLYYIAGACSMVPHTALEWVGKPYETQKMTLAETKLPDYLVLNPQGAVPLLVDDELVLSQNVAILLYLDELNPEANLFGSRVAKERAEAFRWLTFFNADLHKAFTPLFHLPAYVEDEQFKQAMQENARSSILRMLAQANTHLDNHRYFGADISVADVYLYVILRWCNSIGLDYSQLNNLPDFYQRIGENEGVQAVIAQEGLKA